MEKTIIFDFDNTLVDSTAAILECYREKTGDYSTSLEKDLNEWSLISLCPKWTDERICLEFSSAEFFNKLSPMRDAKIILDSLKLKGYKIIIATKHKFGQGILYKAEYINRHFSMVDDVVFASLNKDGNMDKSMISGWLAIDDNIDCLDSINTKYKIAYGNNPYTETNKYPVAKSFKQLMELIEQLEKMDSMIELI